MMRGATRPFDSWDAIKLIALALMFVDHTGHFFYFREHWLRAIGRGAAPIFLFLAGYARSYRFKPDILLLAILMGISDLLLDGHLRPQNILFNILICRLILGWMERRGKKIQRPYEWFLSCIAWLATNFLFHYGSFGLLFAICGYMKKRGDEYPQKLQRNFWILTFVSYGLYSEWLGGFSAGNIILMSMTLAIVARLLWRLELRPIDTKNWPQWLIKLAKFISLYSGYIYAFHLIALEWLTGESF